VSISETVQNNISVTDFAGWEVGLLPPVAGVGLLPNYEG